jgi:hypothetical protein
MKLHLWNELLWDAEGADAYAYCPEHRMKLEIMDNLGNLWSQDNPPTTVHLYLLCPTDEKRFPLPNNSFWVLQRRFDAALESASLKDAEIVDVDGYQVPIAKATPPAKDKEYWAEVRINDTKRGKQLVVYAGKRGSSDKTQIFIDPENDKISFDQNNIHPNDVFTKVIAEFDSGKKTTMEQ